MEHLHHLLFHPTPAPYQFDPLLALQEKAIIVTLQMNRYRVLSATELQDTWQLSTALVYIQLAISRLRSNKQVPGF